MRQIWIGSILLSTALSSAAASLGRYSGAVVIGRPLDIRVQAFVGPEEELSALCVQADVFFGDAQLGAGSVRTTTQRNAPDAEGSVRIQTGVVVNEPIVSVVVRAGCSSPFSRRYVLLADPISEPVAGNAGSADVASLPVSAAADAARALPALPQASLVGAADGGGSSAGVAPATGTPTGAARPAARPSSAQRPASVVRRPAAPASDGPRLQLDPVDLSLAIERDPTLRLSLSMLSEPTSNEAERTAAAMLWKAINATPEEVLRDAQKLSVLEAEAKGLREQEVRNRAALQAMEEQVQRSKYMTWLAYVLGGLLLLSLVGLIWAMRRRNTRDATANTAKQWWTAGASEKSKEPSLRSRVMPSQAADLDIDLNVDDASGFDDFKPLHDSGPSSGIAPLTDSDRREFPASHHIGVSRSVATEELFDVQQQSDFFVSLGEFDQAIGILKNHLGDSQEPSALAYLDLFNLYHKLGRKAEYEALREEFNHLFNAGAPPFDQYSDESQGLEAYETAFGRIQALWPQPKVLDVIEQSIFRDANDVESEVFDLQAYRELLLLHAIAKDMIKRDSEGISPSDFQHTAIRPLKAAGQKGVVGSAMADERMVTQPFDEMPHASPRLGLDVDLDALSEMSAFEASLPEVPVPVEATAKPVAAPGSREPRLPEGNLIDFEVLDFMPPDEPVEPGKEKKDEGNG